MSYALKIKAFFFNAKTDYLPYYKHFKITVEDDATVKDMLVQIHDANDMFSFPKQKLIMKVNGLVLDGSQKLSVLVEKLGTQLQIDPVISYRSNNGLHINDDDFMRSFSLLESYATEADLQYYKTLYALHYASETSLFEREYIGDAILVLAYKMIKEGSQHKDAILEAISSAPSGLYDCEYENNLFNAQNHTEAINELKLMLNPSQMPTFRENLKARIFKKKKVAQRAIKSIDNLEEKHIAYYAGNAKVKPSIIQQMIVDIGAREISFSRTNKLSGLSILSKSKTLALKKAGATLLDAYDASAEVLVIEDKASYEMFTKNFSNIERTIGRNMIEFELILAKDFVSQVSTLDI